jgi:hypothetical protein
MCGIGARMDVKVAKSARVRHGLCLRRVEAGGGDVGHSLGHWLKGCYSWIFWPSERGAENISRDDE